MYPHSTVQCTHKSFVDDWYLYEIWRRPFILIINFEETLLIPKGPCFLYFIFVESKGSFSPVVMFSS